MTNHTKNNRSYKEMVEMLDTVDLDTVKDLDTPENISSLMLWGIMLDDRHMINMAEHAINRHFISNGNDCGPAHNRLVLAINSIKDTVLGTK